MNASSLSIRSRLLQAVSVGTLVLLLAACSKEAKSKRALKRADDYFQKGQYNEAKIEYANVLRLDPKNAPAIKNLGIIWDEQGAPLRALPYLLRTMADTPKDIEARTRVATVFLALDARAEAANTAAAILLDQADNARALVLLADAARLPGEIAQVRARIDQFPNKDTAAYHLAQGSMLLKSGEAKRGEEELNEAAQLDPKDPLPYLALANIEISRRQMDLAAERFKTASGLAKPRSLSALAHAEFLLQCDRLKEAAAAVKPVKDSVPDYLPARRLEAQILFAMGDKAGANKQLQEILRQDPENLEGAILQAQVWMAEGESKKAEDLLGRLNKKLPKYPVIRFEIARCASMSGNPERAIQLLDELVQTNPDYAQAVLVLNELRLRKGDARTAVAALETFCRARQAYPPAEALLAQGYRALGRQPEAIAIYQKLLRGNGNRQSIQFQIGMALREMKRDAEAIQSLEESWKLDSSNLAPLAELIEVDLERKDYASALRRLSEGKKEGAESAEILYLRGKVEAAQSQWDLAEKTFIKASELNPSLPGVYESLLNIYIATGRLKEAGEQAAALCAQKPDDVQALTTLGKIKSQLGENDAATKVYEKLLALKPDSTIALNNLACLYSEQPAQLDKAYALARRARELQSSNPAVADTLGWISFKRKEYPQALALLQESAGQLSKHSEVMFHLGMTSYMMGRAEPAIAALEKAASSPEKFAAKGEIPVRLALLRKADSYDIATLKEMGNKNPDDVYVWYRLGGLLRETRDFKGAAAAYQKGIDANPQMLPCLLELAALNAGPLQRSEAAAEQMRQASKLAAGDPVSAAIVGAMAFQMHDWARAYSLLSDVSRAAGDKAQPSIQLARAAYALGKTGEAARMMSEIAGAGTAEERAKASRLLQLLKAIDDGSDSDAGRIANEALSEDSDDVMALMAAGTAERRQGKLPEARAHLIRVLEIVPEFPLAQKQLAAVYLQDPSQKARAHELASKARRALPMDAELAGILAESSFNQKEYEYARRLFEEHARKTPLTPPGLYMLAVCYWEQKSTKAAAETFRKALDAGVTGAMRNESERLLKLCDERLAESAK